MKKKKWLSTLFVPLVAMLLLTSCSVLCRGFREGDRVVAKRDCSLYHVVFTSNKVFSAASYDVETACIVNADETGQITQGPEGAVVPDVNGIDCWIHISLDKGCEGYMLCGDFDKEVADED